MLVEPNSRQPLEEVSSEDPPDEVRNPSLVLCGSCSVDRWLFGQVCQSKGDNERHRNVLATELRAGGYPNHRAKVTESQRYWHRCVQQERDCRCRCAFGRCPRTSKQKPENGLPVFRVFAFLRLGILHMVSHFFQNRRASYYYYCDYFHLHHYDDDHNYGYDYKI